MVRQNSRIRTEFLYHTGILNDLDSSLIGWLLPHFSHTQHARFLLEQILVKQKSDLAHLFEHFHTVPQN